ncbi:MAG TPA: sigma-70 family RNA polymerase sigma factor [Anaeromyxobacteraceae bacterium]|nr:sigma-70 family RNA polymerase sigma factor [Anaeromyxobacteraceae bacterium]
MEADDLSLVRQARAGDDKAFQALVVRYQRKVYAVALGIVRDTDTAWDVAQEAFVRAHGHLAELEGEEAFAKWLFRITSHLSIDSVRRERRSLKDSMEDVAESELNAGGEGILSTPLGLDPADNALRRELAGRMEAALSRLPAIHREILVLRELEGLSYEELADRLGIQKGTVMSRLFHARKKMQVLLADYAGVPAGGDGDGDGEREGSEP